MAIKIPAKAQTYIRIATPFLEMGADALARLDKDKVGADDVGAELMHYSVAALNAIIDGDPLPPVPQILIDTAGTTDTSLAPVKTE